MCDDVSARLAGEKRTIISSAHGELGVRKERRSKLILRGPPRRGSIHEFTNVIFHFHEFTNGKKRFHEFTNHFLGFSRT